MNTRQIFDWLNGVLADRKIPPAAFKLAYAIAQHVNAATGVAFPSKGRLGSIIGVDDRSVVRLARRLRDAGHIDIEMRGGRHLTNRYRLLETVTAVSSFPDDTVTFDDRKGDIPVLETVTAVSPELLQEPLRELSERESAPTQRAPLGALVVQSDFETFWRLSPKQTDKPAVQAAFNVALKSASAEDIIAGMRRYAASRQGEEWRFHKNPTAWLQGQLWNDVLPAKQDRPPQRGGRGKPSFLDIAKQHLNEMEGE